MSLIERFVEYAGEFEKTYVDDDWSRLERFFAPNATYEVRNVPFACRIEGREAILRGMRKSVNGFDRRFESREIDVTAPPREEGDMVSVPWKGTYRKAGAPPLTIAGCSEARYEGDRIVALSDTYEEAIAAAVGDWMRAHGTGLDPSYT